MSTLPPREEDGQGIGAVASSEYMIANDGGEYDRQQDIIRRRRLFLAVAALLVLGLAAISAIAHESSTNAESFQKIDVPDYVWDVCQGDENDSDILCYRSGEHYECSCECYGFSWFEGQDPQITERTCGDDDGEYLY